MLILIAIVAYKEDLIRILKQSNAVAIVIDLAFNTALRCKKLNITLQITLINAIKGVFKILIKTIL